jgi:hypothetical protein
MFSIVSIAALCRSFVLVPNSFIVCTTIDYLSVSLISTKLPDSPVFESYF